jgi:hypothetical protein
MADDLEKAFCSYMNAIRSKLQNRDEQPVEKGLLRLFPTRELKAIGDLESEPDFHRLVMETRSSFWEIYHPKDGWWRQSVRNFFRRSGFGGVPVNGGSHFEGSEVPVLPGSQSAKNLSHQLQGHYPIPGDI